MSARRWPWLLCAVVVLPLAVQIYTTRPLAGSADTAAAYDAKLAAEPGTAPAEAAVRTALNTLVAVTAAPDLVLQSDQRWRENRGPAAGDARSDLPSAQARAAALQQQTAFWREAMARRLDEDGLAHDCVYRVPYAPCSVTASGEVPGSFGGLRYQAEARFLAGGTRPTSNRRFATDEAADRSEPMVGTTIEVFAPDSAGGWRLVLAFSGEPDERPEQVDSPAGPLLVVTGDNHPEPVLYEVMDGRWRTLYQASWLRGLAANAPPGTCLDGGFYLGQWPWPKRLIPALSRTHLDVATLTVDSAYFR